MRNAPSSLTARCRCAAPALRKSIAKAQRDPKIEPDRMLNDLRREPVSVVADFLHCLGYRAVKRTASLKRVSMPGGAFPALSTGAGPCSCSIRAIWRAARRISSFWIGSTTGSPPSGISILHVSRSRGRSCTCSASRVAKRQTPVCRNNFASACGLSRGLSKALDGRLAEGGVSPKHRLRIAPSGSRKVAARCPGVGVPEWLLRWRAALALRKSKGARCKIISKAS
jgi:hypothetical protein